MKRFYLVLIACILVATALLPLACSYPPSYPPNFGGPQTPTATPTATIPPVVLSLYTGGPPLYSANGSAGPALSAPITISKGQAVVWDASLNGHPLFIDNTGSVCNLGTNGVSGNTSFPVTYAFTTTGDFLAHCQIHGACAGGNSNCPTSGCSGMAATIHVQ